MAEKQYDVLSSFTAIIDDKPVRISGQKQAHLVAKMPEDERAMQIALGHIREYDAPVVRGARKLDGLPNDDARAAQKALDAQHKAAAREEAKEPEEGRGRAKAGAK